MDFARINLADNQVLAREIVKESVGKRFKNREDFQKFRNKIVKANKGHIFHNLYLIRAYNDLVNEGIIGEDAQFFTLIQKRSIRTMSGVSPVTVLTKAFPCPGRCVYCPTDKRMPKSYLISQPAAQRGFRQRFNPYTQVFVRLKALQMTGHPISKIELRVLGGTWSCYPKKYQTWFLKRCLQAMNEFHERLNSQKEIIKSQSIKNPYGENDEVNTLLIKSLGGNSQTWSRVVKDNEVSSVRCIGINIETRPDFIDENEVRRLRYLGVTKVEMGVQTTDDKVQELTKRGHDLQAVKKATALLKNAGFKIGYHMMPNLPGSSPELDKKMIGELFSDQGYQPDYLKIYPCVVLPKSELSLIHKRGDFQIYNDNTLEEILLQNLKDVPEWCRVDRVARDIPANEIQAGFRHSNIRQILERKMAIAGRPCRDIRSREIKTEEIVSGNIELVVRNYQASGGTEFFLSFEDLKKDKLIALLRLRYPDLVCISALVNAALIREVHVYGKQVAVGKKGLNKQHSGWGTKLLDVAEKLAKKAGWSKVAIIAGIGTREYYQRRGYHLDGTYMVKLI